LRDRLQTYIPPAPHVSYNLVPRKSTERIQSIETPPKSTRIVAPSYVGFSISRWIQNEKLLHVDSTHQSALFIRLLITEGREGH